MFNIDCHKSNLVIGAAGEPEREEVTMKHTIMILMTLLLFVHRATPVAANEPLKAKLEKLITDVQKIIEKAEPVFRDDVFGQWAKLTFGIRHMTYIVDTRDPDKTLGVVTFMCKVTQSDYFATKEEAEQAPIKNMVPQLIPCRATYEWQADRWQYTGGSTYVRRGNWEPIPTDKPNAFPQLYFDLMKGTPQSSLSQPNKQEDAPPQEGSSQSSPEAAAS